MTVKIKIKITDAITNEVITDSEVTIREYDYEIAKANHECMRQAFPDACVSFFMDNGDLICSPPVNQEIDEDAMDVGMMTWAEYCNKWYKGSLTGPNEDDPDGLSDADLVVLERYEAEDWASRDACPL